MESTETVRDITDITREELISFLGQQGIAPYRAGQILRWVYLRQADSFQEMTDLSGENRDLLSGCFSINRLERTGLEESEDGSKKYLFRLHDGAAIETVLIPERDHETLCISSQAGCAQGCRFCLTGKGGFVRNLSAGEILSQVRDVCRGPDGPKRLTNIVLMGMGEPLANYRNVVQALRLLTDSEAGLCFAGRRVTLSTAGLAPRIADLGRDTTVNLAVSLNAADDETRSRLMPINRTYPLEVLISACRNFPLKRGRRITFEYILIQGINDSAEDARRLVKLLRPVKAKINLIPFNEHGGSEFRRPEESTVLEFQEILVRNHYTAIIRRSKGADISAACGQLAGGQRSEVRDQRSEVRGQRSEVRDQRSEVRGQRSEIRGQRSEVRDQRSEVRGQRSEVRDQKLETRNSQPVTRNLTPDT